MSAPKPAYFLMKRAESIIKVPADDGICAMADAARPISMKRAVNADSIRARRRTCGAGHHRHICK